MAEAFAEVSARTLDEKADRREVIKRRIFDIIFIFGFCASLISGPFPQYSSAASVILLACIAVSFFDENFYLYIALFMYLRYRLLIGGTPSFRIYSYLLVIRILTELPKLKFRMIYLPAMIVFLMHCIFAVGRFENMRLGFNVIVDCAISYIVVCRVLMNADLFRKFVFAFIMGGIASGIYGWTNDMYTVDIHVRGAGAYEVKRNFGALSDSNFAGLFYTLCIICTIGLSGIPKLLRAVFLVIFGVMLLQTASLSAMSLLVILSVVLVILKYRMKSAVILLLAFVVITLVIAFILSVPQLRQIEEISGLLIRINEKMGYISRGRLDLLTTGRYTIWQEALRVFNAKSAWSKLIGGSVVTVMSTDETVMKTACHNSYLQGLLNFGIIGTLLIYIPFFGSLGYKTLMHFTQKSGYENEDLNILRIIFLFSFAVFGMSVDFFIDWPFMIFCFM